MESALCGLFFLFGIQGLKNAYSMVMVKCYNKTEQINVTLKMSKP